MSNSRLSLECVWTNGVCSKTMFVDERHRSKYLKLTRVYSTTGAAHGWKLGRDLLSFGGFSLCNRLPPSGGISALKWFRNAQIYGWHVALGCPGQDSCSNSVWLYTSKCSGAFPTLSLNILESKSCFLFLAQSTLARIWERVMWQKRNKASQVYLLWGNSCTVSNGAYGLADIVICLYQEKL